MFEIQLKCPALIENIEFLDDICKDVLVKSGFKNYKKLNFAIHETIINSINAVIEKFGDKNLEEITISIKTDKERAEVIIKDKAGGISDEEWININKKEFTDVLMHDRGRGFLFIKHLVDSFEYSVDDNGESTFKLIKGSECNE